MGYSYCARTGRLACDACGATEGKTRRRQCPHRVHYPAGAWGFPNGGSLPNCQPPALCPACYTKNKATLHKACAVSAALATAREFEKAEKRAQGDKEVRSRWGSWHASVPRGFVGTLFVGLDGENTYHLVTEGSSENRGNWLSDYPADELLPWDGPNGATTKEVSVAEVFEAAA